jgi:hypothetical protein
MGPWVEPPELKRKKKTKEIRERVLKVLNTK